MANENDALYETLCFAYDDVCTVELYDFRSNLIVVQPHDGALVHVKITKRADGKNGPGRLKIDRKLILSGGSADQIVELGVPIDIGLKICIVTPRHAAPASYEIEYKKIARQGSRPAQKPAEPAKPCKPAENADGEDPWWIDDDMPGA